MRPGKGGSIKRVAQALDARAHTIYPSPAPTKPESLSIPQFMALLDAFAQGWSYVGIYDRSWYGRVLVELSEGFASPAQWSRAYEEINDERDMVEWGAIFVEVLG